MGTVRTAPVIDSRERHSSSGVNEIRETLGPLSRRAWVYGLLSVRSTTGIKVLLASWT